MRLKAIGPVIGVSIIGVATLVGLGVGMGEQGNAQAQESRDAEGQGKRLSENDRQIKAHAERMLEEGRNIFRFDTYGSEAFFGDALQLHRAIAGAKNGGVGPGVSPKTALAVGLKVDSDALPNQLKAQLKAGKVNLDDPATTLALLQLNAVVGLTGRFDGGGRIAPERGQAFGKRSQQSLAQLCATKDARVTERGKDRYGRTIGRVSCADIDANAEQVRRGMAWVFVQYAPPGSPLYAFESEARAAKRGLWSDPGAVAPWEWRRSTAGRL